MNDDKGEYQGCGENFRPDTAAHPDCYTEGGNKSGMSGGHTAGGKKVPGTQVPVPDGTGDEFDKLAQLLNHKGDQQ